MPCQRPTCIILLLCLWRTLALMPIRQLSSYVTPQLGYLHSRSTRGAYDIMHATDIFYFSFISSCVDVEDLFCS